MKHLSLCLLLAAIVCAAGCRSEQSDPGAARKELLLFCGAGLRPPVAELAETFGREHGVKVVVDYAGSEVLLSRITLSEQGDLYLPGDRHYTDLAAERGFVLSRASLCYFVPTLLVQKGNPKRISGLGDLVHPGIRFGLGDERACAIGRTSKKMFEKNNIPWDRVKPNLKFQSVTVNELGIQIQAKSLDAVIVWDAVAEYFADHGEQVTIPTEQNIISTVDIGLLAFTKNRALAQQFIDFAASDRGREVFRKYKYRVETPK